MINFDLIVKNIRNRELTERERRAELVENLKGLRLAKYDEIRIPKYREFLDIDFNALLSKDGLIYSPDVVFIPNYRIKDEYIFRDIEEYLFKKFFEIDLMIFQSYHSGDNLDKLIELSKIIPLEINGRKAPSESATSLSARQGIYGEIKNDLYYYVSESLDYEVYTADISNEYHSTGLSLFFKKRINKWGLKNLWI